MDNTKTKIFLSKEDSLIIKAIAIVLMLVHHFFTFPDFYIDGISYNYLNTFAKYFSDPTKICVALFAFLTGWAYFYNKNKTLRYSINKIVRFLINYWMVCIPFLIIAMILGVYDGGIKTTLLELFGLSKLVMIFCWYVYFYIISMLILPYIVKLFDKNFLVGFLVGCVAPIVLGTIVGKVVSNNLIYRVIINLKHFFPCIAMGYLVAKYNIFDLVKKILKVDNKMIYIGIATIPFMARYFVSGLDFIYAPIIIFAIVNLSNSIIFNNKLVKFIGKQSTNIWFLHCAFFSSLGIVLQPIAYFPKNPILVIIWVIVLCSCVSVLINKCINTIYKKVNL